MAEVPDSGGAPGWGHAVFWPAGARWLGIVWVSVIVGAYVGAIEIYPWLGEVSLLWLPNAVLATALLRFRPRDWPYVYVAGIAAEAVGDSIIGIGLSSSVPLGLVNCVEATLFVLVAARIAGGRNNIGLLWVRGALAVLIGAITIPVLTGAFGAAIIQSSWTFDAGHLAAWRTWWFGDALGLLVGVPAGLLLRDSAFSVGRRRSAATAFGGAGAALLLFVVSGVLNADADIWGVEQTAALAAAMLLSLTFGAIGAPIGAILTTSVTLIEAVRGAQNFDEIASVPKNQVLLFMVFGAIYVIAAMTESASRARDHLETANVRLAAAVERAEAANTHRDSLIEELRQANERLGDLAERDPLTGVLNRRGFLDHVQAALDDPADRAALVGVLFVDLDGFKAVNDVYGHRVGDGLLRVVADRLVANTGVEGGQVGRLGGDEFAVLLTGCEVAEVSALARRLERCVRESMIIDGTTLALSCTVGQGLVSAGGGVDTEGLLARADADMYATRRARRQGLAARVEQLRRGLDSGQLLTHFQPVWALGPNGPNLHGFEALIRWQDPERGLVPPDEFIATAEEGGLITRLDLWAATEALRQLAGRPEISVAINFSALSLAAPGTAHQLIEAITVVGRDPTSVIVELTESVDIPDNSQIMASLNQLRQEGIRIALDDFGAGYAGLNNLRRFPVDIVKIDRSLIATLAEDSAQADNTEHFLSGIRQLTHAMGAELLAEGIETTRQLDLVRKLRFDYAQGFFLGKPTPQPSAATLPACGPSQTTRRV